MIQFYAPGLPDDAVLPPDESGHCVRVLRHAEGDEIAVTDGKGRMYRCAISAANPRTVGLEVIEATEVPPHWGCRITLAVAPTKNMDRMEWLVEKAVEMGIDTIVPVLCEHSERKVLKRERLEKTAVSAMKQSLKATLPRVEELTPLKTFLASLPQGTQRFMGYCDSQTERRSMVCECRPGVDTVLLIGPEGDFSAAEVQMAVSAGFMPVTFGQSRLRTETAALFAVQAVHIANQLAQCPH